MSTSGQPEGTPPAMPAPTRARGYAFGPYRLDLASYQLLRDDAPLEVTSKAFDILAILLNQRHRVVTKEELLAAVWRDAVVTDDSLVQCISALRRVLGDDASKPTYITTVARRGYRFAAPATDWVETVEPSPYISTTVPAPVHPAPAARRSPRRAWLGGVAAAVLLASSWYIGTRSTGAVDASARTGPLRFAQQPAPGTTLTSGGALSPDGRHIAFVAEDVETGRSFLWVRPLDAAQPRKLDGTDGAQRPFWSPDSQLLGFIAAGRIKTVSVSGGTPTNVATIGPRPAGAAWSTTNEIIFSTWLSGFSSVRVVGGSTRTLTSLAPGELAHAWPQFLPDGDHFLYSSYGDEKVGGIYLGTLSTGKTTRILDADPGAIYSPLGYLVFARNGILTAQTFDVASQTLEGEPFTIVAGNVAFPSMTNGTILSAAGPLLAFGGAQGESELAWFDRQGRRLGALTTPAPLHNPALSPDETRLFANTFPPAPSGIWSIDLQRDTATRVVSDGTMPVLSPDGRTLAFAATRKEGTGIFTTDLGAADAGTAASLLASGDPKVPMQFTSDRQSLLYYTFSPDGQGLWRLPLGNKTPAPLLDTAANEIQGRLSPDGRWLAYASDESGRWEVYLQSFPDARSRLTISTGGGAEPAWRGDGRELYYLAEDRSLMAVAFQAGTTPQLSRPQLLFRPRVVGEPATYRSHYAVTADGQRFLVDVLRDPSLDPVTLLLNWAR